MNQERGWAIAFAGACGGCVLMHAYASAALAGLMSIQFSAAMICETIRETRK